MSALAMPRKTIGIHIGDFRSKLSKWPTLAKCQKV